jgi:predicted MFS family arabinose efflux permease
MLTPDGWLLFATRCVRLFTYGLPAGVLVLYLRDIGLTEARIGVLPKLSVLGGTAVSLRITTAADRLGRRRMLMAGSVLMALAGVAFALTDNFWVLLVAGTGGGPSGCRGTARP